MRLVQLMVRCRDALRRGEPNAGKFRGGVDLIVDRRRVEVIGLMCKL